MKEKDVGNTLDTTRTNIETKDHNSGSSQINSRKSEIDVIAIFGNYCTSECITTCKTRVSSPQILDKP